MGAVGCANKLTCAVTGAGPGFAGFAFIGPIFVDLSVAIVVDPVADFGLWGLR